MKKKQENVQVSPTHFTLKILWVSGKVTESFHEFRDQADMMASNVLSQNSIHGYVYNLHIIPCFGKMPSINPHGI